MHSNVEINLTKWKSSRICCKYIAVHCTSHPERKANHGHCHLLTLHAQFVCRHRALDWPIPDILLCGVISTQSIRHGTAWLQIRLVTNCCRSKWMVTLPFTTPMSQQTIQFIVHNINHVPITCATEAGQLSGPFDVFELSELVQICLADRCSHQPRAFQVYVKGARYTARRIVVSGWIANWLSPSTSTM